MMVLGAAAPTGGSLFVLVAGIVTAVGGASGLAALLLVASQRRKNQAEARKSAADGATVLTNAAVGLIRPLEDRLTTAEATNTALRTKLTAHEDRDLVQEDKIRHARSQIRALRALLSRIREIVTAPAATSDPAGAVTIIRDLVTRSLDTPADKGR